MAMSQTSPALPAHLEGLAGRARDYVEAASFGQYPAGLCVRLAAFQRLVPAPEPAAAAAKPADRGPSHHRAGVRHRDRRPQTQRRRHDRAPPTARCFAGSPARARRSLRSASPISRSRASSSGRRLLPVFAATCLKGSGPRSLQGIRCAPVAGFVSSVEIEERYVQKALGHASADMTRHYQRRRDRFRVNLTKAAGLSIRRGAPGVQIDHS